MIVRRLARPSGAEGRGHPAAVPGADADPLRGPGRDLRPGAADPAGAAAGRPRPRGAMAAAPLLALGTAATWGLGYVATLGGFRVAIRLWRRCATPHRRPRRHPAAGLVHPGQYRPPRGGAEPGVMEMLGLPAHQLTPLLRATMTPVVLVAAMAFFDGRIALVAAVAFPCVALVYWWAGRLGRAADKAVHKPPPRPANGWWSSPRPSRCCAPMAAAGAAASCSTPPWWRRAEPPAARSGSCCRPAGEFLAGAAQLF